MAVYVVLYKWTEQGIKNVKGTVARVEAAVKAAEAAGGKVLGVWYTQGEYDMVSVSEWPNEQVATAFVLTQGTQGFARTTTLKAWTVNEFTEIVKLIP